MSPRERKSSLNFFIYLFASIQLLGILPAWGDGSAPGPKGETGAKSSPATEALGNIDEEIAKAEAGIKTDPSNAPAHVRLAYLLIKKGALAEAMKSLDEALRLNPRSYDAKTGKGIVLARQGNFKEAEQVLKDALVLNPNPVRTHYELGLLYEKLGEYEKAAAEFKEGIRKHEQGRM